MRPLPPSPQVRRTECLGVAEEALAVAGAAAASASAAAEKARQAGAAAAAAHGEAANACAMAVARAQEAVDEFGELLSDEIQQVCRGGGGLIPR